MMYILHVLGYSWFVMTSYGPTIDVRHHPAGYISDYQLRKPVVSSSDAAIGTTIRITLKNIPDAANITFHIELLNLTASPHSHFTIRDQNGIKEYISLSQKNTIHRFFPGSDALMTLELHHRDPTMIGESLRILYTGM